MSESVEQAARPDWRARAEREAATILDECGRMFLGSARIGITNRDELIALLAVAWLQGVNLGSHETLAAAEEAFDRARAAL